MNIPNDFIFFMLGFGIGMGIAGFIVSITLERKK
jgi:hypothetical protein